MDYKSEINRIRSLINGAELMAVSKTRSIEEILAVRDCGVSLFGENKVQEIKLKFAERPDGIELHMIGHLQSNKARDAVLLTDMIESADSLSILNVINREAEKAEKKMSVLLEVNTSSEKNKYGFPFERIDIIEDVLLKSRSFANLAIKGFMTVGPVNGMDSECCFSRLRKIRDELQSVFTDMDLSVLSMGMSNDFETAVRCGSTEVRIGTLIFGERSYV